MKNLTSGNIYKTFFLFGFPVCLSGLLAQLYNVIDTIIVGQFIGESGLAAIGATSPFVTLLTSIFWGLVSLTVPSLAPQGDKKGPTKEKRNKRYYYF